MENVREAIEIVEKYEKEWECEIETIRILIRSGKGESLIRMRFEDRQKMNDLGWYIDENEWYWSKEIELK